jgi:DNA replication protein DnaC
MYGPPGTGKTGLAWSMVEPWVRNQIEVGNGVPDFAFENTRAYIAEQKARLERKEPLDIQRLLDAEFLVLDDLGAERPSPFALDTISLIIESRHAEGSCRETVVTTNFAPAELAARLGHDDIIIGKRIVSRLVDGALAIKLDRRDLRARRAA